MLDLLVEALLRKHDYHNLGCLLSIYQRFELALNRIVVFHLLYLDPRWLLYSNAQLTRCLLKCLEETSCGIVMSTLIDNSPLLITESVRRLLDREVLEVLLVTRSRLAI